MCGDLLSTVTKITRDRGDLIWIVTPFMSWNEDLLDVDIRANDIWVVSFKTWSRRSRFYGRAQTCINQSNVWNSRKLLHVTLKFETRSFARIYLPRRTSWAWPQPPKFEDRSQEETEWQEQGAREAAWKLAKNVFERMVSSTTRGIQMPNFEVFDARIGSVLNRIIESFYIFSVKQFRVQSTKILDHPLNQPTPLLWSTA